MRAMHGDEKKILTPGSVTGVDKRTLQKVPVLEAQGRQIAGTHADDGNQISGWFDFNKTDGAGR